MTQSPFGAPFMPDWESFVQCVALKKEPSRAHMIELFLDAEVKDAICERYDLTAGLDADDPTFLVQREVILQRFLGYDYVLGRPGGVTMPTNTLVTDDTADLMRDGGRNFMEEHRGPITTWDEFEAYPWPDPKDADFVILEWLQKHLPDDMCIIGSGSTAHFAEYLTWLMGYETLCYALYDNRDLVRAIADRLGRRLAQPQGHALGAGPEHLHGQHLRALRDLEIERARRGRVEPGGVLEGGVHVALALHVEPAQHLVVLADPDLVVPASEHVRHDSLQLDEIVFGHPHSLHTHWSGRPAFC